MLELVGKIRSGRTVLLWKRNIHMDWQTYRKMLHKLGPKTTYPKFICHVLLHAFVFPLSNTFNGQTLHVCNNLMWSNLTKYLIWVKIEGIQQYWLHRKWYLVENCLFSWLKFLCMHSYELNSVMLHMYHKIWRTLVFLKLGSELLDILKDSCCHHSFCLSKSRSKEYHDQP